MVYLAEFNAINKTELSLSPTIFSFSLEKCLFLPHFSLLFFMWHLTDPLPVFLITRRH